MLRLLPSLCVLTACGSPMMSSNTLDIYSNDAQTRRVSNDDETIWTVNMNGCTGSMLTRRLLLTAAHCNPAAGRTYTSGSAMVSGQKDDLRAVRVLERSSTYDYAIVEVQWLKENSSGQRYSPSVLTDPQQLRVGSDNEASELFTVGFPVDKNFVRTYAVGYSKRYTGNYLQYNVGSINGNSGGAVWTVDSKMLVSQTNHGPHQHRQPGWNNNNPENSAAWNGGGRFDKVYTASAILREVFPDGNNKFVDDEGLLEEQDSSEQWDAFAGQLDHSDVIAPINNHLYSQDLDAL